MIKKLLTRRHLLTTAAVAAVGGLGVAGYRSLIAPTHCVFWNLQNTAPSTPSVCCWPISPWHASSVRRICRLCLRRMARPTR